jgi:hypothetical protein
LLEALIQHLDLFFHSLALGYVSNYTNDPWSSLPFKGAKVDIYSKFGAIGAQCTQV